MNTRESKKKDLARYIEKIEREVHHLESGGTVTKFSAIAGGQKDNKIQLEPVIL